jgi:uncharacterized protein YbjT (DUF2867 family)
MAFRNAKEMFQMSTVAVTGGTGHLGRQVVNLLKAEGHRVRVLARSPRQDSDIEWVRGDLATGEGVGEAVAGARAVVHAATHSPAARRGYLLPVDLVRTPSDVDVDGTRRLLAEAERAAIEHFLHVSIVGLERVRLPYARVKLTAEALVRASSVPWSIVPATGFYWLWDRMFTKQMRLPVWPLPTLLMQPVHSDDFAEYVLECLADGARGDREGFAGPERLSLDELARQYLAARAARRPVVPIPVPAALAQAAGGLPSASARYGKTTWLEWLTHRY